MKHSKEKETFAFRIKSLRDLHRISQKMLADSLSISQSTVAGWETQTREPSLLLLHDLSEYFNVTVDYLLGRSDVQLSTDVLPPSGNSATPLEEMLLDAYRAADIGVQRSVCILLGIGSPAERRDKRKNA